METKHFKLPRNKQAAKVEGLGVIRYQILEIRGIGETSPEYQIDFKIVTDAGRNIVGSEILSYPDFSFEIQQKNMLWFGEID